MYQFDFFIENEKSYIWTLPALYEIDGKSYEISQWIDLIDEMCVRLKMKDPELFNSFLEDEKHRKNRITYLSDKQENIHFIKKLDKSNLYLNQKIDAPRSVKLLRKLLDKYKIKNFTLYVIDNPARVKQNKK